MKIYLDTIGCRLNQSEIDAYGMQFRLAGHTLTEHLEEADLVVVNTCGVTTEAASDSRQKIRQAARAGVKRIAVTGCWSTLEEQAARALPGVTDWIPNATKDDLVAQILNLPLEAFDREPLARQPLPGLHQRTRAFLKVQDGCDNHCTFCITRIARGAGRSRPVQAVLADTRAALAGGAQELVLTGVHLGSWGQDFETPAHLFDLIKTLLGETGVPRLRLSSLEPWDIDERFFALWNDPRMCPHLHLPHQSGCAATLRRMARKTSPAEFSAILRSARDAAPGMAVTTDIIVGFPGESDEEFAESLAFVEQAGFAGAHVFNYSARPGTPAARMAGQIAPAVRKARSAAMRAAAAQSAEAYAERWIGREVQVLWEATDAFGPEGWRLHGLAENALRVSAVSPRRLWNEISRVRIFGRSQDGLTGEIVA